MKRCNKLLVLALFLLSSVYMSGQTVAKRFYILEDFTRGTILFTNKSVTNTQLNYDAANGEMLYYDDNNELMVLIGSPQIASITLGEHKFIPIGRKFMEMISLPNKGELYVDWKLKPVYKGKKGAYGQTSQTANVDHINTNYWTNSGYNNESPDEFDVNNNNEYWIFVDNNPVKFKNEKSFLKLMPKEKAETVKTYIKEQKIDMKKLPDVIKAVDYYWMLN